MSFSSVADARTARTAGLLEELHGANAAFARNNAITIPIGNHRDRLLLTDGCDGICKFLERRFVKLFADLFLEDQFIERNGQYGAAVLSGFVGCGN